MTAQAGDGAVARWQEETPIGNGHAREQQERALDRDAADFKMRQKKYRENAVVGVTVGCCASFLLWAVLT